MLSEADLQLQAAATGFRPEVLEGLRSHPFLKTRIALKEQSSLEVGRLDR